MHVLVWWSATVAAAPTPHPAMNGKSCRECHDDPHRSGLAQRGCVDCHTTVAWSPSTFDAAKHATTSYVLDGKHLATPCAGCHPGGKPRTSFVIPSAECLDCHMNPHGVQFAGRKETSCSDCHTTAAWKQWKVDHRSFPLVGAHATMACVGCHPGKTIDSPIASYRGLAKTCEGCHADVHASQFAAAPKRACADCHTQDRWQSNFDHRKTRYPLEGVHVKLACDTCHRATELRNGDVSIRWRLGYADCKDCHANPHPKIALDCKGCHGVETWRPSGAGPTGFNHDATGFKLRQAHAKASCTQCHGTPPAATSRAARTNSTCQSCHPDPHLGRLSGPCFECHTATAWQDVATFEQHRRTRMPLTGRHAVIECSACHKRQGERTWRDLPTDCYGCHSVGLAAVPGHVPDRIHRACGLCHETTAWVPALTVSEVTRLADHDRSFILSAGSHRAVACDSCHVDRARTRAVRCDGCHSTTALRSLHRGPVPAVAASCLRCHPRGARR